MINRVIFIVLDSVVAGELPDAKEYNDLGSDTISNISKAVGGLRLPNMENLGYGCITGLEGIKTIDNPQGAFGKCAELSKGKDTVTGHWEMSGVVLRKALNTYLDGFPKEIINEFEKKIGRKCIGNVVASGTEIIKVLGDTCKERKPDCIYIC